MLAVKTYPPDYIDACRARVREQLQAYDTLLAASGRGKAATALASFAGPFFDNLVLALEMSFVHRTRAVEGKDGNPLNEVRMLADSILRNRGVLSADKTIAYTPESSTLGLEIGAEIRLDHEQFRRLSDAFFTELEARFT